MADKTAYDPTKHNHKDFKYKCGFKYDDVRPNRGMSRLDRTGRETPLNVNSGGYKALIGRCLLRNSGNRQCLFPDNHLNCSISTHPKHKHKGLRKFKGKWKKRENGDAKKNQNKHLQGMS